MQPYPKILRKLHLCASCDKKETDCTRASAADTLDLHQVRNSVHVSKLGRMVWNRPDFIDEGKKTTTNYFKNEDIDSFTVIESY